MEGLAALELAVQAVNFGNALIDAFLKTKGTLTAEQAAAASARLAAFGQANAALHAKVHAELQAIVAKG